MKGSKRISNNLHLLSEKLRNWKKMRKFAALINYGSDR